MRAGFPLLVTVLAVLSAAAVYKTISASSGNPNAGVPKEIFQLYAQWKQANGKLYATPAENDHRLQVFFSQKQFIDKANTDYAEALLKRDGATLEVPAFSLNGFADLTSEEFRVKYAGGRVSPSETLEMTDPADVFPEVSESAGLEQSYDIRVRNQGACGSCWAFSAVAAYEKFYFDKTRTRVDFSQQELVDCETGSMGCRGGYTFKALQYIQGRNIAYASAYPYRGANQACSQVAKPATKLNVAVYYNAFTLGSAVNFANAANHASVMVYCSGKFRYINGAGNFVDGALSGECNTTVDHLLNVVGQNSGAYLNILNSWGTGWGAGGAKMIKPCSNNLLWGANGVISWVQ